MSAGAAYNFTGIELQTETYTTKVGTAGTSVLVYTGPKTAIINAAFSLTVFGWSVEKHNMQQGGATNPIWTLTATYQADLSSGNAPSSVQPPDPTWEIDNVTQEISLFEVDRPLLTNLSSDTKEKIEAALKNPAKGLPLVSSVNIGELANASKVYALAQIGIEGIPTYVPVLKRTITVPSTLNTNYNNANKGKVFSKSRLVSTYGVPFYFQNDLPDNTPQQTPIDNNSNSTLMAAYGYQEGPTRKTTVGSNLIQISTNWTYGRYPVDLFDILA